MKTGLKFILLVGVACLCSCGNVQNGDHGPETDSFPPSDLKVVYNVQVTTTCRNFEVYIMNADGSGKKNLSDWEGADWVYTTHGDKIYFVSDRDSTARMWFLYEMDVEGKNVRRISDRRMADSYVSVSDDGKNILTCPYSKAEKYFLLLEIETGKVIDSIPVALAHIGDPCFSPDGGQIVFRGATRDSGAVDELFIMNADGMGLRQLTTYPASDTSAAWYEYHAGPPHWNTATNRITFPSKRKNNLSVFAVAPDGSDLRQLDNDTVHDCWHSWTSDGKYFVVDRSVNDNPESDIFIMRADGSGLLQLTNDTLSEQGPVFLEEKLNK